jgi:hypothetical protein
MNLGKTISEVFYVPVAEVMLLRHSNSKVRALKAAGASLDEYTFVQPSDSIYDYLAQGRPEVKIVVAIVNDHVHGVYRVNGIKEIGTTRSLVSDNFRKFDEQQRYLEKDAKLFDMVQLKSGLEQRAIFGWSSPRHPVARYGQKLFSSVFI